MKRTKEISKELLDVKRYLSEAISYIHCLEAQNKVYDESESEYEDIIGLTAIAGSNKNFLEAIMNAMNSYRDSIIAKYGTMDEFQTPNSK